MLPGTLKITGESERKVAAYHGNALAAFEGKHVAAILGPSCLLVSAKAVGPFLSVNA
jgi:hypothetical protein